MKKIRFDTFKKILKQEKIKFRTKKNWDITLPINTSRDDIQNLIKICRENNAADWHLIFPKDGERKPKIRMYWG